MIPIPEYIAAEDVDAYIASCEQTAWLLEVLYPPIVPLVITIDDVVVQPGPTDPHPPEDPA